jgi:hypothetical protein
MTSSPAASFLPTVFPFDWLWVFTAMLEVYRYLVNFNGNALVTLFCQIVHMEKPQLSFNSTSFILSDNCRLPRMSTF